MNKLIVALSSVLILAGCGAADADAEGEREFAGYECTDDCSGHEAGYDWAAEKGITDPEDCGGNSDSFIEGCEAYARENAESDDYDY